jgi:S1-C subfamily serine protease
MKTKKIWIALIILVLAALACQAGTAPIIPATQSPSSTPASSQPPIVVQPAPNPVTQQDALETLYQTVIPGIVTISWVSTDQTNGALGSGFVYDDQGHIVTNFHVIDGAPGNKVEVDFTSGYKSYGTVIGTDTDSDLAIIKVEVPPTELHPLPIGDSDSLKVGQTAVAIGNPFGLNGSMTVGIISALGRTQDSLHTASGTSQPYTEAGIIQTDAAINPGNSGGPLLDLNGQIIGINNSIPTNNLAPNGESVNSGVGFAIPSSIVKRVVPILIRDGKYDYPYLGLSSSSDLSLAAIQALGLQVDTGAYVSDVVPGGPADKAGLKGGTQTTSIQGLKAGGDLIIAIDGHTVKQFDDLLLYLIEHKSPGDSVVLTVIRAGQQMDISVTLGKRP